MLDLIAPQLDREGIKGREYGEKGGEGAIILSLSAEGGDYSREAINRGTAIFRGNMVYNFVRVRIIDYPGYQRFFSRAVGIFGVGRRPTHLRP